MAILFHQNSTVMKKYLSLLAIISLFFSCNNNTKGWSAMDKNDFIKTCVQGATVSMGEQTAKSYCSCMQQKLEAKYPNVNDANKLGAQSPDMLEMARGCLGLGGDNNNGTNTNVNDNMSGGEWSDADVQKFMNTCIQNAKNAGGDEQMSNQHCDCVLKKIQKKYKSYAEADRTMTKAEVDALEQECVEERQMKNNGNNY